MVTLKTTDELDPRALAKCIHCLRRGGIVCYPTETFYALGIDPDNQNAREKLYELKGRTSEKNLPLIAADIGMIDRLCKTSHPAFQVLSKRFWPGPLTLVLPARKTSQTYAIRISSNPIARQIAKGFGSPIVSTSTNESGKDPMRTPEELPHTIEQGIAIFIDAGPCQGTAPSTIVSLVEEPPKILREGAIPSQEILSSI